ncbi:FYVE, RhoGEF and PH domain-containing protein 6-like isoform X2 [Saccoglossus kowalevskii]
MNHKDDKSKKRTARAKVLTEIPATTDECDIRGYLYKLKDTKKDWEKFWIVIKDHVLYTYKASEDVAAIKTEPIVGFRVEPIRGS